MHLPAHLTPAAIDRLLDEALAETYPASDPISISFGHDLCPEVHAIRASVAVPSAPMANPSLTNRRH